MVGPWLRWIPDMWANTLLLIVMAGTTASEAQTTFVTIDNLVDREVFGVPGSAVLNNPIAGDRALDAFTLCLRFQMKTLGNPAWPGRGRIITIGDW